ncbi:sulfatase-like hydrolase/transferase [bacterium]|nr:sulfatase-like hydrolase/transferase [bacterium]
MRRAALLLLAACLSCAPPPDTGRVVVLVSIDTLRADRLGAYGDPRGLSPAFDRLARRSTLFTDCASPSSWTMPAMGTLATGLPPSEHGMIYWHLPLDDGVIDTMSEKLGDAGITAAFFGNPIPALEGLDRGFAKWETFEGDDGAAADAAIRWLEAERGRDRLLWAHFLGPHGPYDPARGTRRPDPDLPAKTIAYDAEVQTVDRHLKRLLDAAGPNATIVLTADHGETLDERGAFAYDHGSYLYGELIRVPLLIHTPRGTPRPVRGTVRLADVPATICDAFGVEAPDGAVGISLMESVRGGAPPAPRKTFAFVVEDDPPRSKARRVSVRDGNRKAVFQLKGKTVHYWDLAADPGERHDLARERPEEVAALRAELDEWLASSPMPRIPFEKRFTRDEMERLQSLGYLGGADR